MIIQNKHPSPSEIPSKSNSNINSPTLQNNPRKPKVMNPKNTNVIILTIPIFYKYIGYI